MSASKRQRELNRAKKEHENAKLSAQIATGNVVLTNIAESVMAKLIERQAAQIEVMREALIACRDDLKLRMTLSKDDSLNISNSVLDKMLDAIDITPDQALEQFATLKGLK